MRQTDTTNKAGAEELKKRLLIVDGGEADRAALAKLFRNEFIVLQVATGETALKRMRRYQSGLAVVLLALALPDMDGLDVLQRMREDPSITSIPVIAMGDGAAPEKGQEAIRLGALDYIERPLDPALLRTHIEFAKSKREGEELRVRSRYITLQSDEDKRYRYALKATGTLVIEYDRSNKTYFYDPQIFHSLAGNYDHRALWQILLDDGVADPLDVNALKALAVNLANDKSRESVERRLRLKTLGGDRQWYKVLILKMREEGAGPGKFLVTLNNINSEMQATERLRYQAEFDELTGIHNKMTFCRLTQELAASDSDTRYVLIRWNIEQFKLINDLYGQKAGDEVLLAMANTLSRSLPALGTCGRLVNDHFATCFPKEFLEIDRLMKQVKNGLAGVGVSHGIEITAGIYEIDDVTVPVVQMCDRANLALQTVKGSFQRHSAVYDSSLREAMLQEQEIRSEMGTALDACQFEIFFQPICSYAQGRPVGAEALVRWNHPRKGMLLPGVFLPLFEESGLVAQLDRYVWEKACWWQKERREAGKPDLPISVNMSRTSLYNPDVCNDLLAPIQKYGLSPELCCIEIAETAYHDSPQQLLSTVQRLQKAGIKIIMDSFCDGCPSFSTLRDIPLNGMKVDMKCLSDYDDGGKARTMLMSVLRMARWLNIPVTAKRVETTEQLVLLAGIGCDWAQGRCYAEPMPVEQFDEFLMKEMRPMAEAAPARQEEPDFDLLLSDNQLVTATLETAVGGVGLYELVNGSLEAVRVNRGYYDLLGIDATTHSDYAMAFMEQIDPEDQEKMLETLRKVRESGTPSGVVVRYYHSDGHLMYLDTIIRYLGGKTNHSVYFIGLQDITDHVLRHQRISEEQMRYRILVRRSNTIVMEWDTIRGDFHVEGEWDGYVLSTIPPDRINNGEYDWAAAFHPDDMEAVGNLVRQHLAKDAQNDGAFEVRLAMKRGGYHWCRFAESYIHAEDGTVLFVIVTINDINEEKCTELSLRETAERMNTMIQSVNGGIVIFKVDNKRTICFANDQYYKLLGYTKQLFEEEVSDTWDTVFEEDRLGVQAAIGRALESGEIYYSHTYRAIRRDGRLMWLSCHASLMHGEEGATPQLLVIMSDVTEREKAKDKLRENEASLLAAMGHAGMEYWEYYPDSHSVLLNKRMRLELNLPSCITDSPLHAVKEKQVHPEDAPAFLELHKKIDDGASTATADVRLLTANGYRWKRVCYTAIRNASGTCVKVVGTAQDVDGYKNPVTSQGSEDGTD